MSTLLNLEEFGIQLREEESYAEDHIIDRAEDLKYDSFLGLDTRVLAHSIDSPLNALYHQVVNTELTLQERQRAFDFMYRSPYIEKESLCANALLGVLKDDTLSVDDRFHFLNTLRLQSSLMTVPMHGYVWWFYRTLGEDRGISEDRTEIENKGEEKTIEHRIVGYTEKELRYKLLSAQFILAHPIQDFPLQKTHFLQSQRFLKSIGEDTRESVQIRSEAADMLIRLGTPNFRKIGHQVITELGGMPSKRQTLYNDEQNVHQIDYSQALQKLIERGDKQYSVDEILHRLRSGKTVNGTDDAGESLERIVVDTAYYHGYTMAQILQYVYSYIQTSPHRVELENRFVEELVEMRGWCSTGHVVRLLNVLAGFDHELGLSVDVYKELKSALFARLQFMMSKLPVEQQEELATEFGAEEKGLLQEFVETYTPYEELLIEYRNLPREQFEEFYNRAVNEYTG